MVFVPHDAQLGSCGYEKNTNPLHVITHPLRPSIRLMITLLTSLQSPSTFAIESDDLLKIGLAILCGGLIGAEREFRDKAAGFRTIIFICLGATLFTIFSFKIADAASADPTRITAYIVSGVGFLGAGVILRESGKVIGLTTASIVWLAAALGIGIGAGQYSLTLIATATTLIVLLCFPILERHIDAIEELRTYHVICQKNPDRFRRLEGLLQGSGLIIVRHKLMKKDDHMICIWDASGKRTQHDQVMQKLFDDEEVIELIL